jgi:hypothetical protein
MVIVFPVIAVFSFPIMFLPISAGPVPD